MEQASALVVRVSGMTQGHVHVCLEACTVVWLSLELELGTSGDLRHGCCQDLCAYSATHATRTMLDSQGGSVGQLYRYAHVSDRRMRLMRASPYTRVRVVYTRMQEWTDIRRIQAHMWHAVPVHQNEHQRCTHGISHLQTRRACLLVMQTTTCQGPAKC